MRKVTGAMAVAAVLLVGAMPARAADAGSPFVVEYYYKAKWGHFDEFFRLFKKNHLPVLMREKTMGRIVSVKAESPRYHATEGGRWDLRITITWKDAATANDDYDSSVITKELFPDQKTFEQEEQRRFEILQGHWDVPVETKSLEK